MSYSYDVQDCLQTINEKFQSHMKQKAVKQWNLYWLWQWVVWLSSKRLVTWLFFECCIKRGFQSFLSREYFSRENMWQFQLMAILTYGGEKSREGLTGIRFEQNGLLFGVLDLDDLERVKYFKLRFDPIASHYNTALTNTASLRQHWGIVPYITFRGSCRNGCDHW